MHEFEGAWMVILHDEYKKQVSNPAVVGRHFTVMLNILKSIKADICFGFNFL